MVPELGQPRSGAFLPCGQTVWSLSILHPASLQKGSLSIRIDSQGQQRGGFVGLGANDLVAVPLDAAGGARILRLTFSPTPPFHKL